MFPRAAELRAPSTQPRAGAASLPVAHGQGQAAGAFQLGRKLASLSSKARQAHKLPCWVVVSLQVAFGLEVRDGERSIGRQRGGAELLSWPGKLGEDVSACLVPLF